MLDWTEVCGLEDIPQAGSRVVHRASGHPVALFRASDDRVFALLDRCPHKGGPLSDGLVHGYAVTCPLHGWNIDLNNGHACAPDEGCADTFPVRVEHGRVLLALKGVA
ncbi:nitrite reductase small subunit NirD [Pusillimonas sp. TS35]|nr:nitrite reductase small subunit NirD [Pusillimonas sp. TS35]